jgi:septal ring-binding cell division protein DamX
MEQTCPHCEEKMSDETTTACPSCGAVVRKQARRSREYDGYEVGRRLLRLAPVWLLLIAVAFVLALLVFGWLSRRGAPGEEAFRNEATNQSATTPEAARASSSPPKPTPTPAVAESSASPAATPAAPDEAGSYSVQIGAFADISRANEEVSRLRAAGFEARVSESNAATRFRFRVRSGLYATREEAARLASELRARGVAAGAVIIDPERK